MQTHVGQILFLLVQLGVGVLQLLLRHLELIFNLLAFLVQGQNFFVCLRGSTIRVDGFRGWKWAKKNSLVGD